MRSALGKTRLLPVLSAALLASACSTPDTVRQSFPSAADLAVPPKPKPSIETITSATAAAEHNSAVEAWGDGMALQIGRLCRWANDNGGRFDCPRPPDPG